MKTSMLSILALATATIMAQAPPMPTQFNFARCGMNTMVSGIAQSGCSVTDANCLCKAKSFQKAGAEGIPKKCPAANDQASFINFINVVCQGQQGYPLSVKERSAAAAAYGLGAGSSRRRRSRRSGSGSSSRLESQGEGLLDGVVLASAGLWSAMGAAVGAVAVAAVAL